MSLYDRDYMRSPGTSGPAEDGPKTRSTLRRTVVAIGIALLVLWAAALLLGL